jgi:putative transposase
VLLRLLYLTLTSAFAALRLLPMSDTDKDIEILTLRHQLTVMQRQTPKPRLTSADRALLAALLHRLPRLRLRQLRLIVSPDTILRQHRDLTRRRHADASRHKNPGRPPTRRTIQSLVLRLARENQSSGYRRIHGELTTLGIEVAPSTVWEILKTHGIEPAPQRDRKTWATFLRSQAHAILACDFFTATTLTGTTYYVFAVIEHASRRIRVLGATDHPTAEWTTPGRQEPGHGPAGRLRHGQIPDQGPRQQIHPRVRRGLRDRGHRNHHHRNPHPPHELDHGTVGADLQA